LFPEARLKRYIEMRGADCGSRAHILALSAFWVGILYDQASLDAAYDLVKGWSAEERQSLRDGVPRQALATPFRGRSVNELAREALAISREGLRQRARHDRHNFDETRYLAPLETYVAEKRTSAERWLDAYRSNWNERVEPIYTAAAI